MGSGICTACRGWIFRILLLPALLAAGPLFAQVKKPELPRIIAHSPIALFPGATTILKVRGAKLNNATDVSLEGANVPVKVRLTEKKATDVPNGLDAKDVGDSMVVVEIVAPADLAPGLLRLRIVGPEGDASVQLRVVAGSAGIDEKEPNNGFRDAQPIGCGQTIRGGIKEDKDVDTFQFTGRAGLRIGASILAARAGSLLDGVLTLFDGHGSILAINDDADGRDPRLTFALPADGKYFLTVTDANDRGGEWHRYELTLEEAK